MKLLVKIAPKIVYFVTVLTLMIGMGFVGLYLTVGPGLPEVESIRKIRLQTPMRVFSNDNQLIAEFGDKRRIPITLDQVPKDFINALLATEDQRFYEHSGVDLRGVLRAVIKLAITRTKSEGASTITMQVARNYYLDREKRFSRKFTEMFLAWKIESELSKNEILELFLNKIHFSHRAYGLGAAAQVYYGTTLDKLSLAKLATLAGIPQGESVNNPLSYPKNAEIRRNHVLSRMLAEGHIAQQQYQEAIAEPIETTKHGARSTVNAPYLAEMVRQQVIDQFGKEIAYNDGLQVYTTLDSRLQMSAQQALVDGLEEYDRRHGYRGAEQNYALDETVSQEQMRAWLLEIPLIANLQPALVTQVAEENAEIVLSDGSSHQLSLEAVKWARSYVDENHRGRAVKTVDQVLKIGDLIRVREYSEVVDEKNVTLYKLAQIPEVSGGLVALKPETGAIEALAGGYDFTLNQYNMITQARRQPGSNIKPFIYSAAFEKQYTPASMINDMPIVEADISAENIWRPKNDGDKYLGPTSLRTALRRSKNTVSVRLIREIGPQYAKDYLTNLGFPAENMPPYLSLALGSASFTPLEVVTGYAILANGGFKVKPWFVSRIEDANGQIIDEYQPQQACLKCETLIQARERLAIEAQTLLTKQQNLRSSDELNIVSNDAEGSADLPLPQPFANVPLMSVAEKNMAPRVMEIRNHYLIDNILKEVIHNGTATSTLRRLKSDLLKRSDIAGKTGTTNDAKDAWFSGYNRSHVATSWVGFSDHSKKLGVREFGGIAALPVWQKFMEKALQGTPQINHPMPAGIITVRIDPKNGKLATSLTENPIFELFRSENVPTEYAERPLNNVFNPNEETVDDGNLF